MALPTSSELVDIRERHERAVLGGVDTVARASAAHDDRERLLDAVEHLVPVCNAARIALGLIQRGPLPPAARSALLELHATLADLARARDEGDLEWGGASFEEGVDDEADAHDLRMSA